MDSLMKEFQCVKWHVGLKDPVNPYRRSPNTDVYNNNHKPGRKDKIDTKDKRRVIREASKRKASASIIQKIELPTNVSRMQRILFSAPIMDCRKARKAFYLSQDHMKNRIQLQRARTSWNMTDWSQKFSEARIKLT